MKSLKELYAYKDMIISIVRKDLRTRHKASVLGFLWTFVNPLLQLIVYSVVFSYGNVSLKKQGIIKWVIDNNKNLIAGDYWLDVAIHKKDGFSYDYWKECLTFRMYSNINDLGVMRINHKWELG